MGCGWRQDLEPQGGPGACCEGFQEVEREPGLDGPDIYVELASGGGRCDDVGCDVCLSSVSRAFLNFRWEGEG